MKTQALLFSLFCIVIFPALLNAQEAKNPELKTTSVVEIPNSQKGKFHFALQDFSFGAISGRFTVSSIGFRLGYGITHKDMVFLGSQFIWNPRDGYARTIETKLFYRRYFLDGAFQPFVQAGGGIGFADFTEMSTYNYSKQVYGIFSGGAGVSFRVKRWAFELGMQSDFNRNSTGRFSIGPIVGVSFSF